MMAKAVAVGVHAPNHMLQCKYLLEHFRHLQLGGVLATSHPMPAGTGVQVITELAYFPLHLKIPVSDKEG
jgi:hypothetical protein